MSLQNIKTVCVYCASSNKIDPIYFEEAKKLGKILAEAGIALVFGAGDTGVMGAIGKTMIEAGAKVIGVIPQFMVDHNWHEKGCTELIITNDMHERKRIMAERADAFVVLPGGLGTIEECAETLTWKKLGLQLALKPVVLVNTKNYWDNFIAMLNHAMEENFMNSEGHHDLFTVATSAEDVLPKIASSKQWTAEHAKYLEELLLPAGYHERKKAMEASSADFGTGLMTGQSKAQGQQ